MRKVKWSIRDDGNSTWGKHYCGAYVVFVTDRDGDFTDWEIWDRAEYDALCKALDSDDERAKTNATWKYRACAKGEIYVGMNEFTIGQAVAIEALDAIIRDDQEHEALKRESHARNAEIDRRRQFKVAPEK
jgi:hypothetical protein